MKIKIQKINENVKIVKEAFFKEHCNCYIIEDDKDVIIIDFGIGEINFSTIIDNYYNKDITPVLTHFHFDHLLGIKEFDSIFCSNIVPKDFGLKYLSLDDFEINTVDIKKYDSITNSYIKELLDATEKNYLYEKDIIKTLNFEFEIIHTPGHDSTSISLYEKNNKWLFCGDLIYDGKLIVNLEDSNIEDYISSLIKVRELKIECLFPGHNSIIEKNDIVDLIDKKTDFLKNK